MGGAQYGQSGKSQSAGTDAVSVRRLQQANHFLEKADFFQVYVPQVIKYRMAEKMLSTGTMLLKARKNALPSACFKVSNSQLRNSISEPMAEINSGTK
ncbi:hypothetical protein [Methylophilus sp.]|uniref:hypothetical protein n=1 Tax=Methylophilus sp. TaxID=29541 RepID=UPI00403664D5